jgi:uncharacterized membrane protein YfcA
VILAVIMGAAAGVVSGLLGVGGGILFVPALTLALSLSQVKAEATSLLAIIPVALVGAARQHRYGNVSVRDGVILGALSGAGVAGGVALANALPQRTLRFLFAGMMLFVAVQFLRRFVRARMSRAAGAGGGTNPPDHLPGGAHEGTGPASSDAADGSAGSDTIGGHG